MTRTYAAKRLLEHGPLTLAEVHEITGWKFATVVATLRQLLATGVAAIDYRFRLPNVYRLAE